MNADAAAVLAIVERAFPYVERPAEAEIPFHMDACSNCEMVIRDLRNYPGEQLPFSAVRWFHSDLSSLSAKATAWILPVYLRFVLTAEDARDPLPTQFLIYNLSPAPEYEVETRTRLSMLNIDQLEALQAMVGYWKRDPHWSDFSGDSLDRAADFLSDLLGDRRTRS